MPNPQPTPPQASDSWNETREAAWGALIPDDQWVVFRRGVDALARAEVPLLLGGALALATYTGHWRNTKDVDVIVHHDQHERAKAALLEAGFADYFEREGYDRSWIFRGFLDGVIFDVIWDLPNHGSKSRTPGSSAPAVCTCAGK
jgi:hypothetical protein